MNGQQPPQDREPPDPATVILEWAEPRGEPGAVLRSTLLAVPGCGQDPGGQR